jgi:hypothetical protein
LTTAKNIFDKAIVIMDELTETGAVADSQILEYKHRAPYLLDMWQREIARIENVEIEEEITNLDQTLIISDRNCPSGAYYLAEHFAMADMNEELAAMCRRKYQQLKSEAGKPIPPTEIIDVYGISGIV